MLTFDQNLTVEGENYVFTFREVINNETEKFFVFVQNNKGPVTSFEMKKTGGEWIIVPPVPDWILPVEQQLKMIAEIKGRTR